MDFYRAVEVQQLAPVLALCLGSGKASDKLRQLFQNVNLNDLVWDNFIIKNRLSSAKYILRFEDSRRSVIQAVQNHRTKSDGVHSALSPFNVSSDLFPNGIISDTWFKKYLYDIPFAMVVVHQISPDTDITALGETLAQDSARCLGLSIGYMAIVISDVPDPKSDLDKLDSLRRTSGLPYKLKLFYINNQSETMDQDCSVVVSSIIKSSKSAASDFYSVIERRVHDRSDKYYTMPISNTKTNIKLTPKTLETRNLIKRGMLLQFMNSHNIEASLEVIEHAYENILELISDNAAFFSQPNQPPHDISLYKAWVKLLDILIIHLVRGYFSIEEPIAALRKHQAHVEIGQKLLIKPSPESIALWIANQYHWLADLMVLVPESILNIKQKENSRLSFLQFFGGIRLGDKTHVTTLPYLVYAKAAACILPCADFSLLESDLLSLANPNDLLEYKCKLLQLAYNCNNSSVSHSNTYDSFLKWQLAQNYTTMGDFTRAVESYEGIDPKIITNLPHSYILEELLFAAAKHRDRETLLAEVLRHSLIEYDNTRTSSPVELPTFKKEVLENPPHFLKVEASIFNLNGSDETQAFDDITNQFVITSRFSPRLLEKCFKDTKASIDLQEIIVTFTEGRQLTLLPEGTQEGTVQTAQVDQENVLFNLSNFGDQPMVLLVNEKASSTGWISIDKVEVKVNVIVSSGTRKLVIKATEQHKFDSNKIDHSLKTYSSNGTISRIMLKGRSATGLLVKPFFPKFNCKISSDISFIILGEKLRVPMDITSDEVPLDKLAFSNIYVYVKSTLFKDSKETKDLSMQINWDGLKDDEPLELLGPIKAGKTQFSPSLHASISKSPNAMLESHGEYKAVLEFTVAFTEFSGTSSDVQLCTVEVPVYSQVFVPKFETVSQLSSNRASVLSNPFVVNPEKSEFSMPTPSRTWQLRTELNVQYDLIKQQQIEVNSVELVLQSKSNETSADWVSDAEQNEGAISRSFEIHGKHVSFPHSATITVHATIVYSRPGSEEKLEQKVESKEFVLQLRDPRVLFQVQKVNNVHKFQYMIENPTSRIFTFATSMMTDKALLHGSRWEFEDARNEVPLSNNLIHVLPRSVIKLIFYGTVTADNQSKIELPVLQVFDVNYKVNLPALHLQGSI